MEQARAANGPRERRRNRLGPSAWAMVSEATVAFGALVSLSQLALVLSLSEFGVLSSIQSLVRPAMALATVGAPAVIVRRVAQGMPQGPVWRRGLMVWGAGSAVGAALLILGKPLLLGPASWYPYVILVLAYTVASVHGEVLFAFATGLGDMQMAAMSRIFVTVPRIIALGVFALLERQDLFVWATLALVAHIVGAILSLGYAITRLGVSPVPSSIRNLFAETRSGIGFALGGVSSGTLDASDRPILVNANLGVEAGYYAIGTRLLSFAMLPSLALMRASGAEVFGAASRGLRGVSRATLRWTWPIVALNVVIGVALFFGADLLDLVLPDTHGEVVDVVRWMAWLPLVRSVQQLAGNALDATGYPYARFWLTMLAAALNLGLNLWFIPEYGWHAAAATTALAECLLTVGLVVMVVFGSVKRWDQRVLSADLGLGAT